MRSIVGTAEPRSYKEGDYIAFFDLLATAKAKHPVRGLASVELPTLRTCVNRQQPFGTPEWQQQLATTLRLESTLRPRGRPAKFK
jgi:hypothetical protein